MHWPHSPYKSELERDPVMHWPHSPYKLPLNIMGALVPLFQDHEPHAVLCDMACKTRNPTTGYLLCDRAAHGMEAGDARIPHTHTAYSSTVAPHLGLSTTTKSLAFRVLITSKLSTLETKFLISLFMILR